LKKAQLDTKIILMSIELCESWKNGSIRKVKMMKLYSTGEISSLKE
jgi:hypothetical protein